MIYLLVMMDCNFIRYCFISIIYGDKYIKSISEVIDF